MALLGKLYGKQNNGSGFNLTRQFALLSFTSILLIGLVSTIIMSRLFTEKIITRDAVVSQEFVQSMIQAQEAWHFFSGSADVHPSNPQFLDSFFDHLNYIPDVVRANVYDHSRKVIWTNDNQLKGRLAGDNSELDRALDGDLVYNLGIIGKTDKEEHLGFSKELSGKPVVETYIPVRSADSSTVIGVVELYKIPQGLHHSIIEGQYIIWTGAVIGALMLFVSLYWFIKRASIIMETQQRKLIDSKSLSMIGETVSAVAHSMRNPLASIRASAELTLSDDLEGARESAMDIISETDRLDRWARELLQFTVTNRDSPELIDFNKLVKVSLHEHENLLNRRQIILKDQLTVDKLQVRGHIAPLAQVLNSLIMNGIEAMSSGGELTVSTALNYGKKLAVVKISDTGQGLSEEMKKKLFQPFTTTKARGSGLGLALSRNLMEHYDGTLVLTNNPGHSVTAIIQMPIAEGGL